MGKLWFNGRCSADYGVMVSGQGTFNAPERDVDIEEVPGRNGAVTFDNGRYKNIEVEYQASITRAFRRNAEAVRAWLLAPIGYCRLEDSYHPELFRLARYTGGIEFEMQACNHAGEMKLLFDCKPQRFLKTGEQAIVLTEGRTICNPTAFPALPLIRVYGSGAGTLNVGGTVVKLYDLDPAGYLDLDSEIMDAYEGTINRNGQISAPEFPRLTAGDNAVSWSGGIAKIQITPRWWTI